jgi:hypothetical protein
MIYSLTPNKIFMNFNCRQCQEEYADGKYGRNKSMQEMARFAVGRTKTGLQVWCVRHDMNIIDMDLPADNRLMTMPLHCEICTGPDCEHVS